MMQGGFGERTVKQAMRRGNGTLLNIYYASNLNGVTSLANEDEQQMPMVGYTRAPTVLLSKENAYLDGIVVLVGVME